MARSKHRVRSVGAPPPEKILPIEKNQKKLIKKTKTNSSIGYATYIHRVLKQVHPDLRISKQAMSTCESMMRDMFDRIASEAARLVKINHSKTLSSRDIQTATRLVLPGELAKHAVSEGTKAVTKFSGSLN